MTGRDLIIYILENNLENEQVCIDGMVLGFLTVEEAAIKFGVGVSTIYIWIGQGTLDHIQIGGSYYIPAKCEKPK